MMVVVADDLTGAAEIGGIGIRYNLDVELNTHVNRQSKADLLVISTDTRSMSKSDAILETGKVMDDVIKLYPTLVYKKTDSVLRGYVAEELHVQMQKLNVKRAFFIPANPHLGRTVVDGEYLISGEPLHQTAFANDPEFPAKTSSVTALLSDKGVNIHSRKHTDTVPGEGIIVGDAANSDDLQTWAALAGNDMALAGASGFFSALLDKTAFSVKQTTKPRQFQTPVLIVSGTAFNKSADAIQQLKLDGQPVSYMPADIAQAETYNAKRYLDWCLEIAGYITTFGKAIIAINPADTVGITNQAALLRDKTAIIVSMVFKQTPINELLIEGGSTASAVLKHLGISKLYPAEELSPGVVRMKASDSDLYITIKPGSYTWPETLKQHTLY
ncbi:hypothetical protein KXQ82_04725 [Mucilaginibacter sp. HMF5004]|uniref:four-carbon acid sugar kinase family protein n=1 Tax=Mucilaginibacter rivuli TaxID=2857527 RepID=UPI001C5FBE47|nr:four-carbon acid sugar kinase family protein [Mucilaginibacter rivuli]MBW4889003.1 hypothetical protein [Mucilaginibacter rivuli]